MVEWNPGPGAGLLFVLCVALAGWAALWLFETFDADPVHRPSRWTSVAVVVAIMVLIGCAAGLVVFTGRTA